MKIPTRGDFDTIHRMPLVHCLRVIRINVATDVVSTNDLAVADGFNWLDRRRRPGTKNNLRARSARSDEQERNECEIFHSQNVGVEFALGEFGSGV